MRVLNLVTNQEARFFKKQVGALEARGVETTTVAVPGKHRPDDGRSLADYLRFYRAVLSIVGDGFDLVHANYGLTAPAALLQPVRPVVLTLWGTDLLGRYSWVSRACARASDAVVVMSAEMARELDGDCRVVPHGVDLETFRPLPREATRADLGWDPAARHVLFPYDTGRAVKDYPRAERVVAAARERLDVPVELQAVTGVPHDRMAVYHNAADALLLTSRREGSPNAVKEALACNLPVVSTDVGDVHERLAGVERSHVCREDDCLVDALTSVLAAGERSDGRAAAREVSLDRMAERYLDIYGEVLQASTSWRS